MIRMMIKYKIKPKKLKSFSEAIENFVSSVQKKESEITEYNVFQGPDGVSFIHYVTFPDQKTQSDHIHEVHTKKFNKILKESVESNPVYIPLNETGQATSFVPDTQEEERKVSEDTNLHVNDKVLQETQ